MIDADRADTDGPDTEETLLRERVAENPRPAMLWLVGAAVLVALEFGRIMGGAIQIGSAVSFVLGGLAEIPGWIGGNVADATMPIVGFIVSDAVTLAILFAAAVLVSKYVLPWSLATLNSSAEVEYYLTTLVDARTGDVTTQPVGYISS